MEINTTFVTTRKKCFFLVSNHNWQTTWGKERIWKGKKCFYLRNKKQQQQKKQQLLFAQKEKNKQTKKTAICAVMVFSLCVKFEGFTVFGVICNYNQYRYM